MAKARTDIEPIVEGLLNEGELYISPQRRTELLEKLRQKFPETQRSTLVSAITRVLRRRRQEVSE